MRKIPTLFDRDWKGNRQVIDVITPGCEWVFTSEGYPTEKIDGTAAMILDGDLYKRLELKMGKVAPQGFTPAQAEPDPVTGDMPGWVPVGDGPEDRWLREAFSNANRDKEYLEDGTYELVGPKVQGNPYHLSEHRLDEHGTTWVKIDEPLTFEGLRKFLSEHEIEGIVWWRDSSDPNCDKAKIKRRDFGLPWPVKR